MTGEITLTGQVLPIGGVREKVLAAQRAGLDRVILPRENEHDLDELPAETREAVAFVLVEEISEVFAAAFDSDGARRTVAGGRRLLRRWKNRSHPRRKGIDDDVHEGKGRRRSRERAPVRRARAPRRGAAPTT